MASWKTHVKIAQELINIFPELDNIDFLVGNIAPDCNLENNDFTSFVPPREETHFMLGSSKLTVDVEGFIETHLNEKVTANKCFYLGYLAHLITDMEFQKYIRDPKRVSSIYERIHSKGLSDKVMGLPEDFDTLKTVFTKKMIFEDLEVLENDDFPSYQILWERLLTLKNYIIPIKGFKDDAVIRKIPIMMSAHCVNGSDGLFFNKEKYFEFINHVVLIMTQQIKGLNEKVVR